MRPLLPKSASLTRKYGFVRENRFDSPTAAPLGKKPAFCRSFNDISSKFQAYFKTNSGQKLKFVARRSPPPRGHRNKRELHFEPVHTGDSEYINQLTGLGVMSELSEISELLTKILDVQRESLAEYKRFTEQSLALQKQSAHQQYQNIGRINVLYFAAAS